MASLSRELRKGLEKVVAEARNVAEEAAEKALKGLAVGDAKPHTSLTTQQKALRNRLRAHGRQLGDRRHAEKDTQQLSHLVAECAYEHWHRMLFARFLAENRLLIEPASGVSITIDETKELARERGQDWVALAGEFAVRMLPQVFRQDDPVLEVQLAPEDRKGLEDLLESLPEPVFMADDSLGWTYQFWQAEEKEAINASGEKIGADELGPVTQLFTEDYMVEFLLHNTLGAWWAGKVLAQKPELAKSALSEEALRDACAVGSLKWTYLRFVREDSKPWRPAAGPFDSWPKTAKEITVLDPCMGSGHFLVFALPIIAALRAAEEGFSPKNAALAALRDNLFGLELDARCTQIAAFNLALAAWKVTGYEPIPPLQLACSGIAPNVPEEEWIALAGKDERLRRGMARLYTLFKDAPTLGSLLNPHATDGDLLVASFHELQPLLEKALAQETKDDTAYEMAVTARGLAKAADILAGRFTLATTNVPYLGRSKQDRVLQDYCEHLHAAAKADLATCFVERCLDFCSFGGSTALVTPQNWLFLGTYKKLRALLLRGFTWNALARLGPKAFQTPMWDVNIVLLLMTRAKPNDGHNLIGIDIGDEGSPGSKATALCSKAFLQVSQEGQFQNPDTRVTLTLVEGGTLVSDFGSAYVGILNGDSARFVRLHWEVPRFGESWRTLQGTVERTINYGGRESIVFWQSGKGDLRRLAIELQERLHDADRRGNQAWGKRGVAISQMGELPATLYTGDLFDSNAGVITVRDQTHVSALWAFCSSPEFRLAVRRIDQKINVTNATFAKVPFDLEYWQKVAEETYPHGLPKPFSTDPTQWLFSGHPKGSDQSLHVAVARLLGYRWPRQTGSSFLDCPALSHDDLEFHVDTDGIVSLSALKGEDAAEARVRTLLAAAYSSEWSAAKLSELLAQAGSPGKTLEEWLRDCFFEQHCSLFHQRPIVWHIWDGEQHGFNALVNYHNLVAPNGEGRKTLDKLAFSYLGDWIGRQKAEQRQGKEGADAKLAAALHLQEQLKRILEGEIPYDLFVRWKPLHELAMGWQPDVNDGVRFNIRPFMRAKTLKGKTIFRKPPKIRWEKDRGKEPERPKDDYPWFWGWDEEKENFKGGSSFDGNRWNDLHYSITMKKEARERLKGKQR